MENLYFFIPLFFVVIFCLPLLFRIKCTLNLNKKEFVASIFICKIKLYTIQAYVKGTKIFVKSKKKKQVDFSFKSTSVQFVENFVGNLKDKIQLKKVNVYSRIGLDDANKTATMCGAVIALTKSIFCYIKNKKPTCSMHNYISPNFKKQMQIFCLYFSFSLTLFDIVYSLIISLFGLRRKYGNVQSKLSWWTS